MKADLLIREGRLFTADPRRAAAEAIAIRGNQIVAVGKAEELEALRAPQTRVISAGGNTVLPGFIDSHFHLLTGSLESAEAQLDQVHSLDELEETLRAYAGEHPQKEWITGRGLPYLTFRAEKKDAAEEPGQLNRHLLDAILPQRPLALTAFDGHTVWANTRALELAGILRGGVAGPGAEIVIGADGTATGELREPGACRYVFDLIPPPTEPEKRRLLHTGLRQAAAYGITSVHNMDGNLDQLGRYLALEDAGELTLRVYTPLSVSPETSRKDLLEAVEMADLSPAGMARGGAVKFFMDGVIETYTALLLEPYSGEEANSGKALFSLERFTWLAQEADRLGLQIFVHAIGDGAVRRTLDGFQAVRSANGARDSRHRIEHIELINPADTPRFAELGVIASMQPAHVPLEVAGDDIWPSRVGQDRWDHSFAWRWLRAAGARLVFGSDWPVVTQNPTAGIHAAITRQPWARTRAAHRRKAPADHRQSLDEALLAYSRDAAYAEFQEGNKGMLRPGMLADLVVLSGDLFNFPKERVGRLRPVLTICDGRTVFEA